MAGWLRRHNKALRRVTTTGRELPSNSKLILESFFLNCVEILRKYNFDRSKIYNMDETSIYLDCPSKYSYATKGEKRIKVDTHGGEMVRMSACFSANAFGEKCPIYVLIPRKDELPGYIPPQNVIIMYKQSATFNEDVEVDFLDKVFNEKEGSVLFLDSARCHLTDKVNDKLDSLKIEKVIIPPRMTNLLQPADVGWFSKIKKEYCRKWTEWATTSEKNYTVHGNTKSPGYVLAIQWLSEIWENFPSHQLLNSFDCCGITSNSSLHKTLKSLVESNQIFNYYVDNYEEEDDICGFEGDDDTFETGQGEEFVNTLSLNAKEQIQDEHDNSEDDNENSIEQIESYQNEPIDIALETQPSTSNFESQNFQSTSFHNLNGYVDSNFFVHTNLNEPSRFLSRYEPYHPLSYQNQFGLSNRMYRPFSTIYPVNYENNNFQIFNQESQSLFQSKATPPIQIDLNIQSKSTAISTPSSTKEPVQKKQALINITNVNSSKIKPVRPESQKRVNSQNEQATIETQNKKRGRPALPRDENGKIIRK